MMAMLEGSGSGNEPLNHLRKSMKGISVFWKKELANLLFPHYSVILLDQVNNNALVRTMD